MTYPEYEAKIKEIVANPDSLAAASIELLAEIKKDTDVIDSYHAKNVAAEDRIKKLQETNMQLFLQITDGKGATAQNESSSVDETKPFDNVIGSIFGVEENEEE